MEIEIEPYVNGVIIHKNGTLEFASDFDVFSRGIIVKFKNGERYTVHSSILPIIYLLGYEDEVRDAVSAHMMTVKLIMDLADQFEETYSANLGKELQDIILKLDTIMERVLISGSTNHYLSFDDEIHNVEEIVRRLGKYRKMMTEIAEILRSGEFCIRHVNNGKMSALMILSGLIFYSSDEYSIGDVAKHISVIDVDEELFNTIFQTIGWYSVAIQPGADFDAISRYAELMKCAINSIKSEYADRKRIGDVIMCLLVGTSHRGADAHE